LGTPLSGALNSIDDGSGDRCLSVLERYVVLRGTTMYGASITQVLERYGSFRARSGRPLEHHRA